MAISRLNRLKLAKVKFSKGKINFYYLPTPYYQKMYLNICHRKSYNLKKVFSILLFYCKGKQCRLAVFGILSNRQEQRYPVTFLYNKIRQMSHMFCFQVGGYLPRIPKNSPPQSRTEFSGLNDLLQYIIDLDNEKKRTKPPSSQWVINFCY